ncbi:MAG: PRC-barrel domain-containing protein [Mycobacteriales bacterium]
MFDQNSVQTLSGVTVRETGGDKIGKVAQVYLDDQSGQPEWVTVRTGLFGTRESFVPLAAARFEDGELVVDASKDKVTGAPQADEDGHISEQEEAELYRYYGIGASGTTSNGSGYAVRRATRPPTAAGTPRSPPSAGTPPARPPTTR